LDGQIVLVEFAVRGRTIAKERRMPIEFDRLTVFEHRFGVLLLLHHLIAIVLQSLRLCHVSVGCDMRLCIVAEILNLFECVE